MSYIKQYYTTLQKHTHAHSHSRMPAYAHTDTLSFSDTHTLTHPHTHALIHTQSHYTQTHTHIATTHNHTHIAGRSKLLGKKQQLKKIHSQKIKQNIHSNHQISINIKQLA
jgi:hypothetical protein